MTTAEMLTATDLRSQLKEQERQVEEIEREIGALSLDGSSTTAARKKLQAARDAATTTTAALAEYERRSEAAGERVAELAAAESRLESYRWAVDHFSRAAEVAKARDALRESTTRLKSETRPPAKVSHSLRARRQRRVGAEVEVDLDEDLVEGLALSERVSAEATAAGGEGWPFRFDFGADRFDELKSQAEGLAAEEETNLKRLRAEDPAS